MHLLGPALGRLILGEMPTDQLMLLVVGAILLVLFLVVVLPWLIRAKNIRVSNFSFFKALQIGGLSMEGEAAELASVSPSNNTRSNLRDTVSFDSLGVEKLRAIMRRLHEMDEDALAILGEGTPVKDEVTEDDRVDPAAAMALALTIARQILKQAQQIFSEILWPGTDVVTSLKAIDPDDPKYLKCYYPSDRELASRRWGSSGMEPQKLARDQSWAGAVFDSGVPTFVENCLSPTDFRSAPAQFIRDYPRHLYEKWGIGSLVVWPIRLRFDGAEQTVAVLKVDCNAVNTIRRGEVAELVLKSTAAKIAIVFQVACRDCPELMKQLRVEIEGRRS